MTNKQTGDSAATAVAMFTGVKTIYKTLGYDSKGQLISKCPFGVFKSPKKTMDFFPGFLP